MILAPALVLCEMQPKYARHRRARQRRRLVRLTFVYNLARQPARQRLLAAPKNPGEAVRIGCYIVGAEDCPWLYGPTDLRY